MNFAVLASGNGGNLQAIIDAIHKEKIKAVLKVVISDKKEAYALERARKAKIPDVFINPKDFEDRESFDKAVVEFLHEFKVDFVVLAGFMRIVSEYFIALYPDKILNIHPSLLPEFKGMNAIKKAFDAGVTVTGCTVHIVVREMDAGPIILKEHVSVEPKDTLESLEAKNHQAEHRIYPEAIDLFARGKFKIECGKVIVL